MDSERFGRVLGAGARGAARTLVSAVDAAAAPGPRVARQPRHNAAARPGNTTAAGAAGSPKASAAPVFRARPLPSVPSRRAVAEGSRRFSAAVAAPVRRLSKVLWLEVTGVFFGLFAVSAAIGAWRLRGSVHTVTPGDPARTHLLLALAIAVVFAYFCITSFVRAARRGRRA